MGIPIERFPTWPAAMDRDMAKEYCGLGEKMLAGLEDRGIVRFLPVGPHGKMMAPKSQLDRGIMEIWNMGGELPPSEDMELAD